MPRSILKTSKSTPSFRIDRRVRFGFPPPPVTTFRYLTPIPLITISEPSGSLTDLKRLIDDLLEEKDIKPRQLFKPFVRFTTYELDNTPLSELFPDLFYKP